MAFVFVGLQGYREDIPQIDEHEILVKVRSLALSYRDVTIAKSIYPLLVKDSVIPCSDEAGIVIKVGDQEQGFAIGDSVIAPINATTIWYREGCFRYIRDTH
jgi:NADPH:quinone reductase-like Zn-dependent oxidoreductase